MGTDIHVGIYISRSYGIELCAIPPDKRNYAFFYWLADVRYGDEEPTSGFDHPRGFPTGLPAVPNYPLDGDHSPGYYTLEEFENLKLPKAKQIRETAKRWLKLMRFMAKFHSATPKEVMVIFNFDS